MVIPDGFAQINMRFTGDAAPTGAEITFGIDVQEFAGSPTEAAAVVAAQWDSADFPSLYVGALTLASVLCKFGPNETGPFGTVFPATDGTGANPSKLVNGALLFNKSTALGGRTGRGRFYLPGIPDNQADSDGTVHSGFLSTAAGVASDFLEKLGANDVAMVLLHGDSHPTLGTALVLELVPQAKLATQRRRLRR